MEIWSYICYESLDLKQLSILHLAFISKENFFKKNLISCLIIFIELLLNNHLISGCSIGRERWNMIEAEVSKVVVKFVFFTQMAERIITHYYMCVDLKWSETTQMLDVILIYWEFMNKSGVELHFVPSFFFFSIAENGLFM